MVLGPLTADYQPKNLYENVKIRSYEKDNCLQPPAYSGVLLHPSIIGLAGDDFPVIRVDLGKGKGFPISIHYRLKDPAGAPLCGSGTDHAASPLSSGDHR